MSAAIAASRAPRPSPKRPSPGTRMTRGTGSSSRLFTAAGALHLAEISQTVTPGAHAVVLLDQAGWHLDIPANITLMPLPPKTSELNPVENIWQFIRDNWLSNRVFRSYDDILDHCCYAWNKLPTSPGPSCRSACATGRMSFNQRDLV